MTELSNGKAMSLYQCHQVHHLAQFLQYLQATADPVWKRCHMWDQKQNSQASRQCTCPDSFLATSLEDYLPSTLHMQLHHQQDRHVSIDSGDRIPGRPQELRRNFPACRGSLLPLQAVCHEPLLIYAEQRQPPQMVQLAARHSPLQAIIQEVPSCDPIDA